MNAWIRIALVDRCGATCTSETNVAHTTERHKLVDALTSWARAGCAVIYIRVTVDARVATIAITGVSTNCIHAVAIHAWIRGTFVDVGGAGCPRVTKLTFTDVKVQAINAIAVYTRI